MLVEPETIAEIVDDEHGETTASLAVSAGKFFAILLHVDKYSTNCGIEMSYTHVVRDS